MMDCHEQTIKTYSQVQAHGADLEVAERRYNFELSRPRIHETKLKNARNDVEKTRRYYQMAFSIYVEEYMDLRIADLVKL